MEGSYRFGHMPHQQAPGEGYGFQNSKTPYIWDRSWSSGTLFRHWAKEVTSWAYGAELGPTQLGPVIAGRLGGLARSLARGIPDSLLVNGYQDPLGVQPTLTGIEVVLRGLQKRLGPLSGENSMRARLEFLGFR